MALISHINELVQKNGKIVIEIDSEEILPQKDGIIDSVLCIGCKNTIPVTKINILTDDYTPVTAERGQAVCICKSCYEEGTKKLFELFEQCSRAKEE